MGRIVKTNLKGELHCEDGPAVVWGPNNEYFEYWRNGLIDRYELDGPAVSDEYGVQYCRNGLPHRRVGPAMINKDGKQIFIVNGLTHNTDGPAVINPDGTVEWWICGVRVNPGGSL